MTPQHVNRAESDAVVAKAFNGELIDTRALFCTPSDYCSMFAGETPMKRDRIHISPAYATAMSLYRTAPQHRYFRNTVGVQSAVPDAAADDQLWSVPAFHRPRLARISAGNTNAASTAAAVLAAYARN